MAVVEQDAHRVIADRLQPGNLYRALAGDDLLLPRPVALHFGAGRFDAQVFRRQTKPLAGIEADSEQGLRLVEPELDRPCGAHLRSRSSSESSRASPASMIGTPSRMG